MRAAAFKYVIISGFILFIGGAFLTGGLLPLDMQMVREDALRQWYGFAAIRDVGAILVAVTVIISGFRSIRAQGAKWRHIVVIVTGIGIALFFLTLNSIAVQQMGKLLGTYDFSKMIGLIEFRLKQPNLPEEKRPILMRKLAESRYLQSGERISVPTENDETKEYDPPESIRGFKEHVDSSRQIYNGVRKWSFYWAVIWVAVMLSSILVGVTISVE